MADAIVFYVPDQDVTYVQAIATGPQGAPGTAAIEVDVTGDLATAGAADVYTAVSNNTSVTGVMLRLSLVSGYSTVPKVQFRRKSDGKLYCNAYTLIGFDTVNEQYQIVFAPGVSPVLSAGDILELYVSTAADGTFGVKIDVYGTIAGGSAYS